MTRVSITPGVHAGTIALLLAALDVECVSPAESAPDYVIRPHPCGPEVVKIRWSCPQMYDPDRRREDWKNIQRAHNRQGRRR